ncbi:DUF899 family protein [Streptomyces milbemycinicus]|uniref:DUF899 family protein n=1 Tax=Streptomyces milbemycinicus TaxID=476552 RepID=A0ABW8LDL3_9ACTN
MGRPRPGTRPGLGPQALAGPPLPYSLHPALIRPGPIHGGCTALLDQLDGAAEHIGQHVNFAVVARTPLPRLLTFGRERGWRHLRLLSAADNSYSLDYLAEAVDGSSMPMQLDYSSKP